MPLNLYSLANRMSAETGFAFAGTEGRDDDGNRWLELRPAEYPAGQTFTLRTVVGWRRIDVIFRPGNFAGELVEAMGQAGEASRHVFCTVLAACRDAGAEISLSVNGVKYSPDDDALWTSPWRSLDFAIHRGMLTINEGDTNADLCQIEQWTSRAAVAVLAILPLEVEGGESSETVPEVAGLPEGARTRIEVNRYERDRRNRAAAIAIHGYRCKACGVDMGERYCADAIGLIEVHHTTPISEIGSDDGYIVDPRNELIPLCPNCHSVAHRRTPPFSVDELRDMQHRP